MPIVLRQPAETFVGIKEEVLTPGVINALNRNRTLQEPDDFKELSPKLAATTQGDQRLDFDFRLERIDDSEILIGDVDNRATGATGNGLGLLHAAYRERRAATRALKRLYLGCGGSHRGRRIDGVGLTIHQILSILTAGAGQTQRTRPGTPGAALRYSRSWRTGFLLP